MHKRKKIEEQRGEVWRERRNRKERYKKKREGKQNDYKELNTQKNHIH